MTHVSAVHHRYRCGAKLDRRPAAARLHAISRVMPLALVKVTG